MNRAESRGVRAIGGGPLEGSKWVRVLYLDESGVGSIRKDPYLVVAGVLINADTEWMPISNDLAQILDDTTPNGLERPPCIHTKDVFHGSRHFHRDKWPAENRIDVIAGVGGIPAKYDVPVVWCAMDRREYAKQHPEEPPDQQKADIYCICMLVCLFHAEAYMRGLEDSSEVCSVVLEENKELQKRIPELMDWIRHADRHAEALPKGILNLLPFRKIIDNPGSQPKTASSILQVADYCAFSLKRRVQRSHGGNHLIAPLVSQFLVYRNPDDLASKEAMWNPKFSGPLSDLVELRGGKFVKRGLVGRLRRRAKKLIKRTFGGGGV